MQRVHRMIGLAALPGHCLSGGACIGGGYGLFADRQSQRPERPRFPISGGQSDWGERPGGDYRLCVGLFLVRRGTFGRRRGVVTFVTQQTVTPVIVNGEVMIGAALPVAAPTYDIPASDYDFAYINGQRVLVEPTARKIVYVVP